MHKRIDIFCNLHVLSEKRIQFRAFSVIRGPPAVEVKQTTMIVVVTQKMSRGGLVSTIFFFNFFFCHLHFTVMEEMKLAAARQRHKVAYQNWAKKPPAGLFQANRRPLVQLNCKERLNISFFFLFGWRARETERETQRERERENF